MPRVVHWFVLDGPPSCGKTTLINMLMGLGKHVVPEAAVMVIDKAIAAGKTIEDLHLNEKAFQESILDTKVELEAAESPDEETIFDRGMHGTKAYLRQHGVAVDARVTQICDRATYKTVFLLEPLPDFAKNYFRPNKEDLEFSKSLFGKLYEAYAESGIEPVIVPVMPKQDRLNFILAHL